MFECSSVSPRTRTLSTFQLKDVYINEKEMMTADSKCILLLTVLFFFFPPDYFTLYVGAGAA